MSRIRAFTLPTLRQSPDATVPDPLGTAATYAFNSNLRINPTLANGVHSTRTARWSITK